MVAIQALTKYSLKISREQNALTLNAIFGDEKYPFELNEDNQILLQRQKLQSLKPGKSIEFLIAHTDNL